MSKDKSETHLKVDLKVDLKFEGNAHLESDILNSDLFDSSFFLKPWTSFEHKIRKYILLKKELSASESQMNLNLDSFVVGCSGGADSLALLVCLRRVFPLAKITVAYFHHGDSDEQQQEIYRNASELFIKKWIEQFNSQVACDAFVQHQNQTHPKTYSSVQFITKKFHREMDFRLSGIEPFEKGASDSEGAYKLEREKFFSELSHLGVIALGHHLDDVLETRLLKLLRGSGVEGFSAFQFFGKNRIRPFIESSKAEILDYMKHNNLKYIEDPSNSQSHYNRNWIRQEWLPSLEKKMPGATKQLALSLDRLVQSQLESDLWLKSLVPSFKIEENESLSERSEKSDRRSEKQDLQYEIFHKKSHSLEAQMSRHEYNKLNSEQKLRVIAVILKKMNLFEFNSDDLIFLRSHLDKNQKDHIFSLKSLQWIVNAERIVVLLQ